MVLSDPKVLVLLTIRSCLKNEFQTLDWFPIAIPDSICKFQLPRCCFCPCFANVVGHAPTELLPLSIFDAVRWLGICTRIMTEGINSLFCGLCCSLGNSEGLVPWWNHPGNSNSKNCEDYFITDTEQLKTQPRLFAATQVPTPHFWCCLFRRVTGRAGRSYTKEWKPSTLTAVGLGGLRAKEAP